MGVPTVQPTPWTIEDDARRSDEALPELREIQFLQVVLGTCRYLLDNTLAQTCHDLIKFFGEQLLILLNEAVDPQKPDLPEDLAQLLLDSFAIFAMQRDMMELLAVHNIWLKCKHLCEDTYKHNSRIILACLRMLAVIAMHPSHRIHWIGEEGTYPPRQEFTAFLDKHLQKDGQKDDSIHTLASLLRTAFQEEKLSPQENMEDIEEIISWLVTWWRKNTTARYEEEKEIAEAAGDTDADQVHLEEINADDILQRARKGTAKGNSLTVMEAMPYCAPYESTVILSLLSRLALEPLLKPLLATEELLKTLLACIACGIWVEARDAAAVLANLLWYGGLQEERLCCWLKFDHSVAADSANVCLPIKAGSPKLVDVGTGVDHWGVEFTTDSSVILHPDGLKTHKVPGVLSSASPSDTFSTTAAAFRHMGKKGPSEKQWTITSWFWWPLGGGYTQRKHILMQSKKSPLIWCNMKPNGKGVWSYLSTDGNVKELKTPPMSPGWHMIAVVSSTVESSNQFNGTKIFFDTYPVEKPNDFIPNEFFIVGNDAAGGKCPFGVMADFRIYGRALSDEEVEDLAAREPSTLLDEIPRRLANLGAVEVLSRRLDVPDSCAECLRCLASLANYSALRPLVFAYAGRKALELLHSPLPMLQRQAARLLQNAV